MSKDKKKVMSGWCSVVLRSLASFFYCVSSSSSSSSGDGKKVKPTAAAASGPEDNMIAAAKHFSSAHKKLDQLYVPCLFSLEMVAPHVNQQDPHDHSSPYLCF
ncbi:hypothetical protein LOK49_LG01G01375 [Camellia lanceoleosa]|uniref:Uncharacterized protein n=1 Tax=Camellia lanceoleosa TaxID=1840588 RepID=A0ACC0J3U5_9ERIC|nr:hypothetical protein LOK49_LG01G01375 [Camellia lanceoleosa]